MKKKDIVYAALAAIILVVAGVIVTTQLMPKKASSAKANEVEVAWPFSSELDQGALSQINDASKVRDFGTTYDLSVGLGNSTLFGN